MSVYLKLIWAYLKIGLFGFGGGYAMLSLVQNIIVENGWLSSQMFTDIVAISQMTPGPIGINSATYIGYVSTGTVWGSIVATLAVVLPPYLLTLYAIASAALLLMNKENFGLAGSSDNIISIIICVASFCVVFFTKIHPIVVIILAGIAGYFIF